MSTTMTRKAPARKASRKADLTASLIVNINHMAYAVAFVHPAPEFGSRAVRLSKCGGDKATYDILVAPHGIECSCPDFIARHADQGTFCKHAAGLVAVGLLEVPAPAPAEVVWPEGRWAIDVPAVEPSADEPGFSAEEVAAIVAEGRREVAAGPPPTRCPRCLEVAESIDPEAGCCGPCVRETAVPCCGPESVPCVSCSHPSPGFATELAAAVAANDAAEDEVTVPAGCHTADELAEWVRPARRPLPIRTAPDTPRPIRPAALPDGTYSLADLISGQAALLRGQGSAPFSFMADRLEPLAAEVRFVGASTVSEAEGRLAELENNRLYDSFNDGFRQGEAQALAGV